MKSPHQIRAEKLPPDQVKLLRAEAPELVKELESIYNVMAGAGHEPSEKVRHLILWLRQEIEVLSDAEYDPNFSCKVCGYGENNT